MTYLSETRVEVIGAWLAMDTFEKNWEGVWIDGYGGEMTIAELDDDTIEFSISVVRGPTYHLGDIHGEARTNGQMARFAIQPQGFDAETWISFLKKEMLND